MPSAYIYITYRKNTHIYIYMQYISLSIYCLLQEEASDTCCDAEAGNKLHPFSQVQHVFFHQSSLQGVAAAGRRRTRCASSAPRQRFQTAKVPKVPSSNGQRR